MVKNMGARVSVEEDPFMAVRVAAVEARRLNLEIGKLKGRQYINPAVLAFERLQAGLLQYSSEERKGFRDSEEDGVGISLRSPAPEAERADGIMDDSPLGCSAPVLEPGIEQADQDYAGSQVGHQFAENLGHRHEGRIGHEDQTSALVGDGSDQPDPEAETDPFSPAGAVERRVDPPIHVSE